MSLARVGSRAALSFAFAFLRRAWRSGEDSDLCCDLLQESLDALRALPEATLYDEKSVSAVWIDTVDRATKFVRNVVEGCEPLQAFHFLFLNILHTTGVFSVQESRLGSSRLSSSKSASCRPAALVGALL